MSLAQKMTENQKFASLDFPLRKGCYEPLSDTEITPLLGTIIDEYILPISVYSLM